MPLLVEDRDARGLIEPSSAPQAARWWARHARPVDPLYARRALPVLTTLTRAPRCTLRVAAVVLVVVAMTVVNLAAPLRDPRLVGSNADSDDAWPGWGFTHTQFSADHGDPRAIATAETAVKAVRMVQAQPVMGWGVANPEPSPGRYEFESLDRRMDFIRRSGGVPVITLCCAPDWMKGGQPGETDWDRLTAAPLPDHFADFAALSATIAKRYPYVRHFLVWNEFKGFFDPTRNRWDAEKYTDLYNLVYDALKAVNPHNQVGGPYLDFDSRPVGSQDSSPYLNGPWGAIDQRVLDAFTYWKLGRRGADFVVVDGHATTSAGAPDEFAALEKFTVIGAWVRLQVNVPIWWSEWYAEPDRVDWSPEHQVALRVAAMIHLASTAAATILYWNPRPDGARCATCLWTDTSAATGGQPLPFLTDQLQRFARSFPPGVDRWRVQLGDGTLALASPRALVMVNTTDETASASLGGRRIELAPYETRWLTSHAHGTMAE